MTNDLHITISVSAGEAKYEDGQICLPLTVPAGDFPIGVEVAYSKEEKAIKLLFEYGDSDEGHSDAYFDWGSVKFGEKSGRLYAVVIEGLDLADRWDSQSISNTVEQKASGKFRKRIEENVSTGLGVLKLIFDQPLRERVFT